MPWLQKVRNWSCILKLFFIIREYLQHYWAIFDYKVYNIIPLLNPRQFMVNLNGMSYQPFSGDDAYLQHHWMPYGPGHNSVFLVCCALWGGEKAEAYKYVQAGLFKNGWKTRDWWIMCSCPSWMFTRPLSILPEWVLSPNFWCFCRSFTGTLRVTLSDSPRWRRRSLRARQVNPKLEKMVISHS